MNPSGTDISKKERIRPRRLHLHVQVPLRDVISVRVWLDVGVAQGRRVLREFDCARWKGERRQMVGSSVFKEGCYTHRKEFELIRQGKNIEDTKPGPYQETAVAERVPCHTESRLKIGLGRVSEVRTAE